MASYTTEGIVKILVDNAGVGALVGDRIADQIVPRGWAEPYIYVSLENTEREHAIDGGVGVFAGTVEIAIVATNPAAREAVADAVRNALDNLAPITISAASGDVRYHYIGYETESDEVLLSEDESDDRLWIRRMLFTVAQEETIPN